MVAPDIVPFARALLRSPRTVGAVAPSSVVLGDRLAVVVPQGDDAVIVELGAGTGAVTARIDRRRSPRSTFVAFERDALLAARLAERAPRVRVIAGDARNLGAHLAEHGLDKADAVVCGLPWANFSEVEQLALLGEIRRALAPGGAFTTFAYVHALVLPPARRFRALLASEFEEVLRTRAVVRNLPPAITYVCRRPR